MRTRQITRNDFASANAISDRDRPLKPGEKQCCFCYRVPKQLGSVFREQNHLVHPDDSPSCPAHPVCDLCAVYIGAEWVVAPDNFYRARSRMYAAWLWLRYRNRETANAAASSSEQSAS